MGRLDEALPLRQEAYSEFLKLKGEEHMYSLQAANNYAMTLINLQRHAEARALMRKTMPVARRVLGDNDRLTLKMRWAYAKALYLDDGATLDDTREAANTLEETEGIARRVLGGAHPLTTEIERTLRNAQATLRAHEAA